VTYLPGRIAGGLASAPQRSTGSQNGLWQRAYPYLLAALLICATAVLLKLLEYVLDPRDLTVLFLIPIMFCAWKLGQGPALCASFLSVFLSATFVFEPLFDPRVASRHHLTHLVVFLITAVFAGKIAHDARRATASLIARHRETEALYSFSRRLTNLSSRAAIFAAMREHLAAELGERLLLIAPGHRSEPAIDTEHSAALPPSVSDAIRSALERTMPAEGAEIIDPEDSSTWVIKPLHPTKPDLGVIVVNIGRGASRGIDPRQHIDATLRDAVSRLQRLDVELVLDEARLREKSEELREALIGSVTHDLRTPIATIMGSASVLSKAPPVAESEKLSGLARLIAIAAGQLDQKISNLINATRISSHGVKPHFAWVDPTDIINAALRESEASLSNHKVSRVVPGEPPLIDTDPVLLKEVLRQFLDNAAKYSSPGSEITIRLAVEPANLVISVEDQGAGMTQSEIDQAFERFYRGPSQIGKSAGTGIGLWISQAFALVCGAQVKVTSRGSGSGAAISVIVPLRSIAHEEDPGMTDG